MGNEGIRLVQRNRRAEGIEMWNSGIPQKEIAHRLGVKRPTVATWISRARATGTEVRGRQQTPARLMIARMKHEGCGNIEIGRAVGRSARSVAVTVCLMRKRGELPPLERWS